MREAGDVSAAGDETWGTAADRTTGRSVLRGGAWLTFALTLPQFYTLVLSVVAARFLGPADMGRQSYLAFVSSALTMVVTLGLPIAMQRYIGVTIGAGRPGQARGLVAWAWKVVGGLAVLGFVAVYSFGFFQYEDLRVAWLLAGLVTGLSILQATAATTLLGLQLWRQASVFGLAAGAITVVASVLVLHLGHGITGMFAVQAAATAFSMAGTAWLARRAIVRVAPVKEDPERLPRQVVRFAALMSLSILLEVVLTRRSEFFFLQHYSPSEQLAYYSIAFAAVAAAATITAALNPVAITAVATLSGAEQPERISSGYSRGMRMLLTVGLALTAGALALGPLTIRVVYGDDYAPAGIVLVVLVFVPLLVTPLAAFAGATLAGINVLAMPLLWGVAGLFVDLAIAFALIPHLDAIGAALANNGGRLVAGLPVVFLASRRFRARWWGRRILAAGLAAACCGLIAWGVSAAVAAVSHDALALAAGCVAGVGAYLAAATTVKVLGTDDAEWLREALGPRLGPVIRVVDLIGARSR